MSEGPTNTPIIPADQRKIMHVVASANGPEIMSQQEIVVLGQSKLTAQEKAANEARKMTLLVARVQKAIGNRMEGNVVMGACMHVLAQCIAQLPREEHPKIVQNLVNALDYCLMQTYPPEYVAHLQAQREAAQATMGGNVVDQMVNQMADQIEANYKASLTQEAGQEDTGGVPANDQG